MSSGIVSLEIRIHEYGPLQVPGIKCRVPRYREKCRVPRYREYQELSVVSPDTVVPRYRCPQIPLSPDTVRVPRYRDVPRYRERIRRPMATAEPSNARVPVICASPSTFIGAEIFNPNPWPPASRSIIHSCMAEFSVLHHCVGQIEAICKESEKLCQPQIVTLQEQWAAAKFNLDRVVLFGEQPDLHMRIKAFFSGVKSLLDLMVQLLSSEKIVSAAIHGFHRDKDVYGGSVLKALQNNVPKDQKELAEKIGTLLSEHKADWIDQVIYARDQLIHPMRGMPQLMFQFECEEIDGSLVCTQISPPVIDSTPINHYARRTLEQAGIFAAAFIALLQGSAVSSSGEQPTPGSGRG